MPMDNHSSLMSWNLTFFNIYSQSRSHYKSSLNQWVQIIFRNQKVRCLSSTSLPKMKNKWVIIMPLTKLSRAMRVCSRHEDLDQLPLSWYSYFINIKNAGIIIRRIRAARSKYRVHNYLDIQDTLFSSSWQSYDWHKFQDSDRSKVPRDLTIRFEWVYVDADAAIPEGF